MTITLAPPRPQWLPWRRGGCGATDAAIILGIPSTWASPWSVWAEKVGLIRTTDDDDDDDPREFGRRAEAMLAPWYEDYTGRRVVASQLALTHPTKHWARATPDGATAEFDPCTGGGDCPVPGHAAYGPHTREWGRQFVDDIAALLEMAKVRRGLEVKTDGDPRVWDPNDIDLKHTVQAQWQMACTGPVADGGWDSVDLAVLHGRRFRVYTIDRDDKFIAWALGEVERFWEEYVLPKKPPPPDGSDATKRALSAVYADGIDPAKEVDLDRLEGTVTELIEAKLLAKQAEARAQVAANEIKAAMGDAAIGNVRGRLAATQRAGTQRRVCKACGDVNETAPFITLTTHTDYLPDEAPTEGTAA